MGYSLHRRDLDLRNRRREVELKDSEPGAVERLLERLLREEMRVRTVEDPAVRVLPAAGQQPEPHCPVGDVRGREDKSTARTEQRSNTRQEAHGITEMLDQIAAEHEV